MAKMTLTIPKASAVDSSGKKLDTGLSMTTGAEAAAGRSILKAEYYTKGKMDTSWGTKQSETDLTFLFTLQYVEFHKQIYSPNYIEAYILIKPEDIDNKVVKAFPNKNQLNELFATQLVQLKCDDISVCDDYYVHEIIRRRYSDKMFVTLKIYSPDKVMTLKEYCRAFTSKMLGEEILKSEIGKFSITRDTVTTALVYDTTGMKHLQIKVGEKTAMDSNGKALKDESGNEIKEPVYREHIFPYLVQYNESFYDFLARTTNRWGEFFYYENNKLRLGYNTSVEEKKYKMEDNDIDVMSYCDCNLSRPEQTGVGFYVGDAPYDSNILKSVVKKDGYDAVKNTIAQMADFDNGGDVYLMKKAATVLNNSKSITNFLFDTVVDDLVALGATEARVAANNNKANRAYFDTKETAHGKLPNHDKVHFSSDSKSYNEFSEDSPMVNASSYSDILQKEVKAGHNAVNIEFDTKYPDLKLGQMIDVDGEKFIVVEVVGYQPETAKKDSQSYYEKGFDSKVVRYRVTAIAKDGDGYFYPPVLPSGHVRKSGPQVAVVVDVDDPNRANRVRVKYPWQFDTEMDEKLNAEIQKIDAELAESYKTIDKDTTKTEKEKSDAKTAEKKKKDEEKNAKIKEYTDKKDAYQTAKADDLKTEDVTNASPWLLYASSSGPIKAGVHGRHYLAERVLIDYAGGNVERPYVVGAVSTNVPVAIKTGSAVMMAPNGEFIKVHEGMGNGAAAFIANLSPGLKMINSFVPFSFTPDNEVSRRFEGGVEMGDKYGIWSIKASTDARNVSISSPWGDVKIDAFTGITISAPNGDVRITGKNVTIAAGNNLTLTSGTNIRNKFASTYDGGKKFNVLTYLADVGKMVAKKLASMAISLVDLSILRSIVEVFWKPQEGALTVKSNRFLKLEAGGASAGYPDSVYKDPKKPPKKYYVPYLNDTTQDNTLKMGKAMGMILGKVDSIVEEMIAEYRELHADYIKKLNAYANAVNDLKKYSNVRGDEDFPCKTKEQLKDVVWTADKKKVEEADVDFKPGVKTDSNDDVDDEQVQPIMEGVANGVTGKVSRGRRYLILDKKTDDEAKGFIIKKRKAHKESVVKAANDVLNSVINLKNVSFDTGTWTEGLGYTLGTFTSHMPAEYIKPLQKAFSKDNLKETAFCKYQEHDDRRNDNFNDDLFRKTALKRRAALSLVEEWGAEPQAVPFKIVNNVIKKIKSVGGAPVVPVKPERPKTDDDFEGVKYNLYVFSLKLTKNIKQETGFGMSLLKDLIDKVKFWAPVEEYYSWGNAKNGQILFGTGPTFVMNGSGEIKSINTVSSRNKLNREDLNEADQGKYDQMTTDLKNALLGNDWTNVKNVVETAPEEQIENVANNLVVVPVDH